MKKSNLSKILVILGPTSSGKSDIAIKIAKKFNGEIISADSRQIYRGMDVGTGKIPRDRKLSKKLALGNSESSARGRKNPSFDSKKIYFSHGIPHHMIDIISPRTDYNVAKFKNQAEKIIEDISKHGKLPIICGGTGFWIQAVVDNVDLPEVKPDWSLRKKLEIYPAKKLFAILKKIDSERAVNIDPKNKVRLIRAIEICKSIGKVPKNSYALRIARYKTLQIGLKLSRDKLYKNIEERVKNRFKQGMVKEVEKLYKERLPWKKIQSFGLAYFWIPLYLQNKLSKKELFEKVIQAEKKYAKRQLTWFKRDQRIRWIKNYSEAEKLTRIFIARK